MHKHVPLTSTLMLASILGIMISTLYVFDLSVTWGFTLTLFFIITFIASVVSMSRIEAEDEYGLKELAIHERRKKK